MSDYVRWIVGALVVLALGFAAVSYMQGKEAEILRLEAEIDSLAADTARMREQIVAIDSAWAADSARRVEERERTRTVFRSSVDTIRAALPDSLQGVVDRMVRADSAEDAAYEADIAQLHERIRARDSALVAMRGLLEAKDRLIGKLRQPDPLTVRLPLGLEASPGVGCGLSTAGQAGCVAGVVIN